MLLLVSVMRVYRTRGDSASVYVPISLLICERLTYHGRLGTSTYSAFAGAFSHRPEGENKTAAEMYLLLFVPWFYVACFTSIRPGAALPPGVWPRHAT